MQASSSSASTLKASLFVTSKKGVRQYSSVKTTVSVRMQGSPNSKSREKQPLCALEPK